MRVQAIEWYAGCLPNPPAPLTVFLMKRWTIFIYIFAPYSHDSINKRVRGKKYGESATLHLIITLVNPAFSFIIDIAFWSVPNEFQLFFRFLCMCLCASSWCFVDGINQPNMCTINTRNDNNRECGSTSNEQCTISATEIISFFFCYLHTHNFSNIASPRRTHEHTHTSSPSHQNQQKITQGPNEKKKTGISTLWVIKTKSHSHNHKTWFFCKFAKLSKFILLLVSRCIVVSFVYNSIIPKRL